MNSISFFARQLMTAGLTGGTAKIPEEFLKYLEVFDVPSRPDAWEFRWQDSRRGKICVPVSGGLDSTICYLLARSVVGPENIVAVYMDFGQVYRDKELGALASLEIEHLTFRFPVTEQRFDWKHIIPARNLVILSWIAENIPAETIYFGAVRGEIKAILGGDKSLRFIEMLKRDLAGLPAPVKLRLPLANLTKADAIGMIGVRGTSLDYLARTVSCFSGGDGHCGECQSCLRRYIAFASNGLCLDDFRTDIREGTRFYQRRYQDKMTRALETEDFSEYDERRCRQTLKILETMK